MNPKATLSAIFIWFLRRPRSVRRYLGRNADTFIELFKALSYIGGMLFWPGVILYVFGVPLGMTLLTTFLLLVIGSLVFGGMVAACANARDNWDKDHKWYQIRRDQKNPPAKVSKAKKGDVINIHPDMVVAR